jgi:hypothetical protein
MKTENCKFKWLEGHGRNLKIPRIKWKWKHNLPEPQQIVKAVLRRKLIAVRAYILKKSERY